ncbi:hypothetical protein HA520_02580 [Azotobacter chroococcum]|uniref:Phasin family protein n=1 Tax=Azotobacter chroococcum TaxID=353 RepID=A0AA43Z4Y3_9GAMM|nr:hypothetical protein [Azotobacter chroococcum]NHN76178.1 hypothetical protein [Azotobacter chroococcum]
MDAITMGPMIDPALSEAIKHWNDYASESAQNMHALLATLDPLQGALQIGQSVAEAVRFAHWTPAGMSLANPAIFSLSLAFKELSNIQLAALNRGYEAYTQILKTTLGIGQQLAETMQGAANPQQLLAAYLEASLNIAKQYEADISNQVSNLNDLQAAYNIWFQRTLDSLIEKGALEPVFS